MLTEIIVYMGLFAVLFGGAFTATFQTIETIQHLQVQKDAVDDMYFLQARLDAFVKSSADWGNLSQDVFEKTISSPTLSIESFSSQVFETATSSSRVLFLTIGVNRKSYTFSYVQEK